MEENIYYDLIVAGGGLSGVAAAVAAAREGLHVLIIEQYGFLGGMATAGLVNPFMPWEVRLNEDTLDSGNISNAGIFMEIYNHLKDMEGIHYCLEDIPSDRQGFNEELLKLLLDGMINEYGIKVLLHTYATGVNVEGGKVKSINVSNKSGNRSYNAAYFVDATGDADICAAAGCEFVIGRKGDHQCQPMTLNFRIANVDTSKYDIVKCRKFVNEKFNELREKGKIDIPRNEVLVFYHSVKNIIHFNTTRVINKLAINAEDLTQAEIEGRRQAYQLYEFMRDNIPGFENSIMLMSGTQIGVRESRRIIGEYVLTTEDILSARKFEDSIARGTYPLDIHSPDGKGSYLEDIPYGDYYTIPYRSLIPKGVSNLIVAGRPISASHEAHSSIRTMPICTCIGEAAGIATAIAARENIPFAKVEYIKIHTLMDTHNALY
jgi:hypothetical protein